MQFPMRRVGRLVRRACTVMYRHEVALARDSRARAPLRSHRGRWTATHHLFSMLFESSECTYFVVEWVRPLSFRKKDAATLGRTILRGSNRSRARKRSVTTHYYLKPKYDAATSSHFATSETTLRGLSKRIRRSDREPVVRPRRKSESYRYRRLPTPSA